MNKKEILGIIGKATNYTDTEIDKLYLIKLNDILQDMKQEFLKEEKTESIMKILTENISVDEMQNILQGLEKQIRDLYEEAKKTDIDIRKYRNHIHELNIAYQSLAIPKGRENEEKLEAILKAKEVILKAKKEKVIRKQQEKNGENFLEDSNEKKIKPEEKSEEKELELLPINKWVEEREAIDEQPTGNITALVKKFGMQKKQGKMGTPLGKKPQETLKGKGR